jgi:DNA-binding NtrC family response regulator
MPSCIGFLFVEQNVGSMPSCYSTSMQDQQEEHIMSMPLHFAGFSQDSPTERQGPTILIVDDEPIILEVLSRYFRLNGLVPLTAKGAREGIATFTRRHCDIALVLLDVQMPDLSGLETLAALRRIDPEVRCCFMSGDLGLTTAEELHAAGVLRLFQKPFALHELAATLWEMVRR